MKKLNEKKALIPIESTEKKVFQSLAAASSFL